MTTARALNVAAIQMPITMDVAANLHILAAEVSALPPLTLAVAPEGCLSGYLPEQGLTSRLDGGATQRAIEETRRIASDARVHLVVGACIEVDGIWRNSAFYIGPKSELHRYDKINLAMSERGDFVAGDGLPVFDIEIGGRPIRLGVQMCREIRYPEQWRHLSGQGAEVIAYVNNAIGNPKGPDLWRAHVISRAAENQRFVIGANNAAPDQGCTSLIVSPEGVALAEAGLGATATVQAVIDLNAVSNWIIDQARSDVVAVGGPPE